MALKFFALAVFGTLVMNPECGTTPASTNVVAAPAQNVQPITVNSGPANNYANGLFTSVTVCMPGSASNCQTIDGVLVDTGSIGLRILSSALTLNLPQQTANGSPVVECNQFVDGFTWGPVQVADIAMAGERAGAVPIQVIGASGFSTIPASCTSTGPSEDTLDTLGANGVLGIGLFRQDCGPGCAVAGASNPGLYFTCSGSSCQPTAEGIAQQLQNPVWLFAKDNNGVIVELPAVSPLGAATVNGSLVFGIGTQANNAPGSAAVFTVDGQGTFTTVYQGQSYGGSFLDTGSNALYFLDSRTSGLPLCPDTADFYCPASSQSFSATHRGANGTTGAVPFGVANADTLLGNLSFSVFSLLAGPNPGSFDWGLPFFFGRNVLTAIESQNTPLGFGPYWAY
ncbi:MAG: DUF3443 domain-containing protein [Acidobacteriota bacterium]